MASDERKPDRPGPLPDCNACRHYYVTWDERRPYGCRAFGFKSRHKPVLVVLESSGDACRQFEAKP